MIKIRHHIQMHSRTTRTVPMMKKSANRHFHRHRHLCHCRPFFLSTSTSTATYSSTHPSTHASTHAASAFSSWSLENASQGLLSLLTNQQRTLLDEQKELSSKALKLAHEIGGVNLQYCSTATSPFLQQIISPYDNETDNGGGNGKHSDEILDSTFSVVIAGEFNAGKSTLINALLGQKLLETGALPTTDTITVLASKQQQQNSNDQPSPSSSSSPTIETTTSHSNAITIHRVPNIPLLNDLTFIDTPGTNAIISLNHTQRTIKLLPSADLILFVTSADRPFPESERKLLHSIQAYRKNIVIIINKMDILESSGGNYGQLEKEKVRDFVRLNASDLLGLNVMIFNVSARDALSSKLIHGGNRSSGSMSMSHGSNHSSNSNSNSINNNGDRDRIESSKMWQRSGFASLESFLKESLTEEAKIQAKLLNPLGVTDGMLSECLHVLEDRKKELEIDIATYNLLKNQMKSWRYDMDNDIREFQDDVRGHMVKEMDRCNSFIDSIGFFEKYSLCLFDNDGNGATSGSGSGSKLESKWENTKSVIVSNDIEQEILESIRESTDAIATSARAQGQAVIEYLGKRPAIVGQNLIGSVTAASRFEDTRKELYEKITKSLENVLANYDAEKEKKDVFQSLKHTMYLSSSLHILSVASGLVTAFEMVDIFQGGLATFSFAVVGFGVVPQRNRFMVKDFEKRWEERNEKLSSALDVLCAKEIKRIHKRILHGVSPYSRYVTSEQENVETYTEECHALSATSQSLRNRIAKLK